MFYPFPARIANAIAISACISLFQPGAIGISTAPEPLPAGADRRESGTIDIQFKDEDVRKAVELVALQMGKKAIVSEKVAGKVTATLYGVTGRQILDAITHPNGLGYTEDDDAIHVYTEQEMRAMGKGQLLPPTPPLPRFVKPGDPLSQPLSTTVTIDRTNAEIQEVLELLSIKCKMNIIASKGVQGLVTVKATDVALGEVLRQLLTPRGDTFAESGNMVFVYSKAESEAIARTQNAYVLGFTMNRIEGAKEDLSIYKGKVVLIVNVASHCGYTKQYDGLEKLYESKKGDGFVILGFPANEFGKQEPGSNTEIKEFCTSKFNVSFPMFEKIIVKGEGTAPLYQKLAAQPSPIGGEPKWNFTKFLVDRNGNVVARYEPAIKPDDKDLVAKIDALLKSEPTGVSPRPSGK